MMNKNTFILDFNLLEEQNIHITEFSTLLRIYREEDNFIRGKNNPILLSLESKGFIKIFTEEHSNEATKIIIREKGLSLLEFITIEESITIRKDKKIVNKSSRRINNELDDFIEEFRNKWKGLKLGSMGSLGACRDKMFRWMKENPERTKEEILSAADKYIQSLDNYTYLQQADYFIYKKDAHGESSRLSAFIDEEDIKQEGWSSNLN